ncbi:MAG TPA: flagellar basal body-associated FliL family protein [bacterium]|nr:flagellar basal body-associated FliL family protein [bacterium]HPP88137.1 flagellar basal body-associated FliL family protein [bacterium]
MAKEKEETTEQENTQELPKGNKPLLVKILIGAIAGVIIIGAVIIFSTMSAKKVEDSKLKEGQNLGGEVVSIEDKVLYSTWLLSKGKEPMKFNLRKKDPNAGSGAILVAHIILAWNPADVGMFKKKSPEAELEMRREQLKDIVVKFFSTRTPEEVTLTHEIDLKSALQTQINSVLSEDVARITNIFFSDYFIQQ